MFRVDWGMKTIQISVGKPKMAIKKQCTICKELRKFNKIEDKICSECKGYLSLEPTVTSDNNCGIDILISLANDYEEKYITKAKEAYNSQFVQELEKQCNEPEPKPIQESPKPKKRKLEPIEIPEERYIDFS